MKDSFQIHSDLIELMDGWLGEFLFNYFNRVQVFGKKNIPSSGAILAPNHPSILDPLMLMLSTYKSTNRFIRFVAWAGLLEKEPYKEVLKKANVIPINPPGATGSNEIKKAYPISKTNKMVNESLKNGELVGIFPEGTNHLFWDGSSLYPIQKGVLLWAAMSGCPIIPVGIRNTHLIWPLIANIDLQKFNFQTWIFAPVVFPVTVEIHFGKPIYITKEELKDSIISTEKLNELIGSIKQLGNLS
jgi:1-acyl-sn-glycerol-3-phosphate acyltransferase